MIPETWQKKLSAGGSVLLIGAHNPLSAQIGSLAGFDGIWWSSFELSTSYGLIDASLVWPDEVAFMLLRVSRQLSLPHVIDVDAGYGGPNQLAVAVDRLKTVGANAVCIEDQMHPKFNSLFPGVNRRLCKIGEMVERIQVLRKRNGQQFGIFARLESFVVGEKVEQAIERANAYADAGADAIVVHTAQANIEELISFSKHWRRELPLIAIPTMYGSFGVDDLAGIGFRIIIFANVLVRSAIKAMRESATELIKAQRLGKIEHKLASLDDVMNLVNNSD